MALTVLSVAILAWLMAPAASASPRHVHASGPVAQADAQACECEDDHEFPAGAGRGSVVPLRDSFVLDPVRPGPGVLASGPGRVTFRPARQ